MWITFPTGEKTVSQYTCVKESSITFYLDYSLFTCLYHFPLLDRQDLFSFNMYNPPIRIDL